QKLVQRSDVFIGKQSVQDDQLHPRNLDAARDLRGDVHLADCGSNTPQSAIVPMPRSRDRFLTTHTGSLPRPEDLIRMMFAKEEGIPVEPRPLATRIRSAVGDIVGRQTAAGLDIVNDGEMSKPSYATYIK